MRRADNLTTFIRCLEILAASTSYSPNGLYTGSFNTYSAWKELRIKKWNPRTENLREETQWGACNLSMAEG